MEYRETMTGRKSPKLPRDRIRELFFETPLGPMCLAISDSAASGLRFARPDGPIVTENASPVAMDMIRQVLEFLEGKRREFHLPMSTGGTAFQRRVWEETLRIPYGSTITYGCLATRIGNPAASIAIGAALAANPLLLMVPCHRVIGSDGRLNGYAGDLWRKRRLLDMEAGRPAQPELFPNTGKPIG